MAGSGTARAQRAPPVPYTIRSPWQVLEGHGPRGRPPVPYTIAVTKRTERATFHRLQTVFHGDTAPLTADFNGRMAARHVAASLRDARRVSERRDHVPGPLARTLNRPCSVWRRMI